jgi:hypothetical protein
MKGGRVEERGEREDGGEAVKGGKWTRRQGGRKGGGSGGEGEGGRRGTEGRGKG